MHSSVLLPNLYESGSPRFYLYFKKSDIFTSEKKVKLSKFFLTCCLINFALIVQVGKITIGI